ncbi:ABC transporter permease [Haloarchaeobius sp. HME9146]|uniref:ABC transporter permease n=1 Tax=Haloarchaeobius sp. HME9146 TaxID=2978732 RepID=UPI0021C09617|nr:ABC transporter permease [Haloarchaeobius sp. HME9146]MCT9097907.1 ABC transporter permease [Haloarchaeobius sp. HME9146]
MIGLETGTWALTKREILRYVRRPRNTFLPPFINNVLYFAVFGVILGSRIGEYAGGIPYITFVLPGLVVLGAVSNGFENASFSIFHGRWNEYIHEVLTSPLSYRQLAFAYVAASALRGVLVGVIIAVIGVVFTIANPAYGMVSVAHPVYLLVSLITVAALFACFGILGGLWARDFDYLTVLNQFIIRPLVFFGGVFYPLAALEGTGIWYSLSFLNPMVYMVNAVRYGFLDFSEVDPNLSLGILLAITAVIFTVDVLLLKRGYGLMD